MQWLAQQLTQKPLLLKQAITGNADLPRQYLKALTVNAVTHFLLRTTPACWLLLCAVCASHAAETNPAPATDGRWTEQVDKSIQFGAEAEQQSAEQALSAVASVSKNVQSLKKDVIALNKDLRLMEEQLLFPSSTKFSVFVSLDTGQFLTLESVKLKLDGKLVATHLYSDKQRAAMARGGIQKLYVTNLNEGKHTATAFFTGIGPNGRPYKRAENLEFEKGPGSGYLEIAITDDGKLQEPVFAIKQW